MDVGMVRLPFRAWEDVATAAIAAEVLCPGGLSW